MQGKEPEEPVAEAAEDQGGSVKRDRHRKPLEPFFAAVGRAVQLLEEHTEVYWGEIIEVFDWLAQGVREGAKHGGGELKKLFQQLGRALYTLLLRVFCSKVYRRNFRR